MIDVFYPYFQREAKWDELRYSLRSLEKHFKEPFRIFLVGDIPDWCTNVIHIPHTRSEGMKENTTYDAISKMLRYMNDPQSGGEFIRMYDDTYMISDVTIEKLQEVKAMCYLNDLPPQLTGTWAEQLRRTLQAVIEKGYPGINTESHFPEYFIKKLMLEIIDHYKALENRYLVSTLYHNTCFSWSIFHFFKKDYGIQFYGGDDGVWKCSNEGDLKEKCADKLYLNHNNAGLNDNLKQFLMNRFPDKSIFEK